MTRAEHLAWCKQRAHEYLAIGDIANAVTSMMSDLSKHPETKLNSPTLSMLAVSVVSSHDLSGARRFIDGFT